MREVAAIPALGLLAGAAIGLHYPDGPRAVLWLVLVVCAGAACWTRYVRRPVGLIVAVGAAFAVGGVLIGATAWRAAWRPPLRVAFDDLARSARADAVARGRVPTEDVSVVVPLTGVLRSDATPTDLGASISLSVDGIDTPASQAVSGGVLLTVAGEAARGSVGEWRAGRRIRTTAALRRPSRYLDPGVPDEERLLARRGTTLVGSVKSAALVELAGRGTRLSEAAAAGRVFARRATDEAVGRWSPQSAAIVRAIVIGDRAGLDQTVQRSLQEAGTYHVIAISGGNIAILAGLVLGAFRLAGLLGRAAMLTAIGGLVAYAYFVGGGASVDRATLMAVIYFTGRALDVRGPPLNALAATAALLVVLDPLTVADPGFLLTCGATAGILVGVPLASAGSVWRVLQPVRAMLLASAAAELALLPVGAAIFSRVTFAGLILNFVAIPMMAVAQIAGMTVVPLALVSARAAVAAGYVAHLGAAGLVWSADLVRFAPALTWRVAPPHWFAVASYYAGLIASVGAWTLRARWGSRGSALPRVLLTLRWVPVVATALAALWMVGEPWALVAARGDGRLHVTFLDVGQGDAAFIRLPAGDALMVDTGGVPSSSFDLGDRVVAPVVRSVGVRRLAVLALTHGDGDHIGGAPSLVREFRPREIWEGIPVPPFEPLRVLRMQATSADARWTTLQTHDVTMWGDVQLVVRHPDRPDWERQRVRNDDSLVLELAWKDVSIVLTGDIGRHSEADIVPRFAPARLRVVKVPHHRSLTSSSEPFVRALAPKVAVVSVGRSNTFGHPAPQVLSRYRDAGAAVFRTDQDGAVTVATDGRALDVRTFTGRSLVVR
jgi:competence protein ComEC